MGTPVEVATELARRKAQKVAAEVGGACLVIGCDSVLDVDGEASGKPLDARDATHRWRRLRGSRATLVTGHHLVRTDTGREAYGAAKTDVWFGSPSDVEIAAYVATGEPLRVAGAFTIDGLGGWFIERLDGDHTNVVGISLPLVRRLMSDLGVSVTDVWRPLRSQPPGATAESVDFAEATPGDGVQ